MFRHFRHICFVALALGSTLVAIGGAAVPAGAQTLEDKRLQAAQLEEQLSSTNQELGALGEKYNGAILALQEAEAQLATVQLAVDATEAELARIRGLVAQRAASDYRRARAGQSLDGYDYGDAEDLVQRNHYAETQAQRDDQLLVDLRKAKRDLARQRDAATAARETAAVERQKIEDTKVALESTQAQQQSLLAQVQGEIATLVQEELNKRAAEALALAGSKLQGGDGDPNLPAPGPAAARAIEWGMTQLGKTYVYAATGPDHYDCSGFTMVAFKQSGVNLPHYSGAQYDALPHVPLNAMLPGDLIFWGSHASSHVAIYVGGAQILESGGSGHDVHVGPIWGRPMGAARVLQ